jgi:hypothetical protein
MKILVNDIEVDFPSSLSQITLGQRIDFHQQHGLELDKMAESIRVMEDGPLKELEILGFSFEKMFRTFSFFANVSVDAIKESKFIEDIAQVYYSCLAVLIEDEQDLEAMTEFEFKGELWELQSPEVWNGSKHKFGEFVDAKQIVKDMVELGNGKWEYMLPLCAIYLRKKGEDYKEEFLYPGSERLELMKDLPMDVAMQVGFFLSITMNLFINTLKSLPNQEQRPEENSQGSTLKDGVGSII